MFRYICTCGPVPISGAGTSVWVPIKSCIFWVKTRVSRSSSEQLNSLGLHPIPPLAPPYGMLATAVFHVMSCAKAFTSSGSTCITHNHRVWTPETFLYQILLTTKHDITTVSWFQSLQYNQIQELYYLGMVSDSSFHGTSSIVMLNSKSHKTRQRAIIFWYCTLNLQNLFNR